MACSWDHPSKGLLCRRLGVAMPREVVSKQFSCSEMKEAHSSLLAVKKERLSQSELQKQIQDHYCFMLGILAMLLLMIGVLH